MFSGSLWVTHNADSGSGLWVAGDGGEDPVNFYFLRTDSTDKYLRPDGTSYYLRA